MANEITKVTDQNGVDHPMKDAIAQAGVIANTKLIKDTVGWSGKNKFYEIITGQAIFGNDNEGFHLENSEYGLVYIAKVDNNTDYIVSKEAGDRFRIVAMANHPTTTNQAGHEIVNNNDLTSYEFNSSAYNYIIFTANFTNAYTLSNIKGMIRDADILDSTYEPYFGSTAVDWASYAKTGVGNFYNIDVAPFMVTRASYAKSNNGWHVTSTEAGSYNCIGFYLDLPHNTDFNLVLDVTKVSGDLLTIIDAKSGTDNWTTLCQSANTGHIEIPFNIGNYEYIRFRLLVTLGTSTTGEAKFENIVIKLAEDTNTTYVPFAMTNRELTEVKTLTLTKGTNISTVDNIYAYQIGKVVYVSGFYQTSAAMASKEVAFSGLPTPKAYGDLTRPIVYDQGSFKLGTVEGNNFYVRDTVASGDTVVFAFSYVAS